MVLNQMPRYFLVGNKIADHLDVAGAVPTGDAPTTSYSRLNTWLQWIGQRQLQDETRNCQTFKF